MNDGIKKDGNDLSLPFRGTGGIILAGGLGTRLQEAVPDLPKCMAPVAGKPFISYVIDAMRMQQIEHFVFSLGYKAEIIQDYLNDHYSSLSYSIVTEKEPLGTGGAIRLALQKTKTENVLIANGDTLFKIKAKEIYKLYSNKQAECVLALKPMKDFSRYGMVEINASGKILSFKEKQFYKEGLINGGIYLLNKKKFLSRSFPFKFSFEKDYLEAFYKEETFYGSIQDGYFIDIGVPEDYKKAQDDLKRPELDLKKVDQTWTLFIDRDGVINDERIGEYVLNWEQFIFSKGVLNSFNKLSNTFGKVVVISNQRGVGKQLMTEKELQSIHNDMNREIEDAGGRIDKIYYCTEKDDKCFNRKPNPGMALQALKDFPSIDFSKSIMIGNKPGDMRFGRAAGMHTVFLTTTNPEQVFPHQDIDLMFSSLQEFCNALNS